MRKFKCVLLSIIVVSSLFISCDNSAVSIDARKMADLDCQAQALAAKAEHTDIALVMREASTISAESNAITSKYKTKEDSAKLYEAMSKVMGDCK
mgnify:CR=1 FL=1